jgi:hypothetical protein
MLFINRIGALLILLMLWITACSARAPETRSREMPIRVVEREQQSETVLTWRRSGGIAGFCDEMQISASGEVRIQSCRSNAEKVGKLASDDLQRLNEWRRSFGSVVIEFSDGGLADGMNQKLTLKGTGSGQPADAQRREILEWAQRVHGQSNS